MLRGQHIGPGASNNRVTKIVYPYGSQEGDLLGNEEFGYDDEGHADQLVRWPGMHGNATNAGYTYDGAGNLLTVKDAAGTSTLASYTYTYAGLLDTATYKGADGNNRTLSNTWDADSNRVSFTAASTTHTFVYDPTAGIPAVIQEDGIYYFRTPGGALIAQKNDTAWHYYHFDQLGSTRLLTDSSGDVSDKYSYDAWGKLLWHEKVNANSIDQPYQYVGKLGYYTHYQEPYFGLLQLGVRFYDPGLGRFMQRDAIKRVAQSPYGYVGTNPLVAVDPSGYFASDAEVWAAIWRMMGLKGILAGLLAWRMARDIMDGIQDVCAGLGKDESGWIAPSPIIGGPMEGLVAGWCIKVTRTRGDRPCEYRGKKWPWYEGRCEAEIVDGCAIYRNPGLGRGLL